ncbi:MAG: hypothetical protein IIA90_02780 [Chloroflexi bacterium]|nr:hypothetical protein [Chloroflexota bacterium]
MINLAFRSFTTLGYFAAALLIAIVAVLLLTSFSNDSSGSQAVDTATPTPTPAHTTQAVTIRPAGDGDVWIDRGCAEGAAIHVYSGSGVTIRGIGVRNTGGAGVLIGNKTTGDETPACPLTLG